MLVRGCLALAMVGLGLLGFAWDLPEAPLVMNGAAVGFLLGSLFCLSDDDLF